MAYHLQLANIAEAVMRKQKFLHPLLFDYKGKMYEDVRQKLLAITNFFIKKNVEKIVGIEIIDIILCGSCARYYYNENSDINIKVLIRAKEGHVVQNNEKAIHELFSLMITQYDDFTVEPSLNNLPINITVDASFTDFLGHYSLQQNDWIIKPEKNADKNINIDILLKGYFRILAEINHFMSGFDMTDGTYSVQELQKINDYFSHMSRVHDNLEEYFAYRMLCKTLRMQDFDADNVYAVNDSLSLR